MNLTPLTLRGSCWIDKDREWILPHAAPVLSNDERKDWFRAASDAQNTAVGTIITVTGLMMSPSSVIPSTVGPDVSRNTNIEIIEWRFFEGLLSLPHLGDEACSTRLYRCFCLTREGCRLSSRGPHLAGAP